MSEGRKINSAIILDYETSGFNSVERKGPKDTIIPANAITELAMIAIKLDTLEEIARMNVLVKPYNDNHVYDAGAAQATGITKEKCELEGVSLQELKGEVERVLQASMLYTHHYKAYLVAHNPNFDRNFWSVMCRDLKIQQEKYIQGTVDIWGNFQPQFEDTIFLSKLAYGNDSMVANFQLATCVELFGCELSDGHRAINDTKATTDMLIEQAKRLRNVGGGELENAGQYRQRTTFRFPF